MAQLRSVFQQQTHWRYRKLALSQFSNAGTLTWFLVPFVHLTPGIWHDFNFLKISALWTSWRWKWPEGPDRSNWSGHPYPHNRIQWEYNGLRGENMVHSRASTLRWRHNGCDSVSNPPASRVFILIRRTSKKISKLRVTVLCAGNSPETGEFPAQMASNAENVSIWWRHHEASASNPVMWTVLDHTYETETRSRTGGRMKSTWPNHRGGGGGGGCTCNHRQNGAVALQRVSIYAIIVQ